VAEIELDIERASVDAPYDGIVAGVDVTVGDQVKKDAVLLRLYSLEGLEVRARIPARYQAEIRAALESGAPLVATAQSPGVGVSLTLERLAGEAHPSGVDGLFSVQSGVESLRLGQMISLRLERPERTDAVPVPFAAVYGGRRVYKVVDGRLRGIQVESLGGVKDGNGGERLLVSSPELAAGDLMVVTHMPNAVDGLRVEAIE
jgi:multidrug efflux pump subunit AcrA (membrane-fusion protein)